MVKKQAVSCNPGLLPLRSENLGLLFENLIRNMKYHLIITIALITRFCIEGGMAYETAYTLSDIYIQKLDTLTTEDEISSLHHTLIFEYTNRMKKLRQENIFSMPVVRAMNYIDSHLHEKNSLDELADYLQLNKTYLCKLFKSETGLTLGNYIKKSKVEAAGNMLIYSDYAPSDIGHYFAFSSHSHFINVFKEETGMTPTEYRNRNFGRHFDTL